MGQSAAEAAGLDKATLLGKLGAEWKRQLSSHAKEANGVEIFAVYSDEALTGWAGIIMKPWIGEIQRKPCLLMPLPSWMHLKAHAAETVTPFRIVLQGNKSVLARGWLGITGLKYAVRHTEHGCCIHIPLTEFKAVME